MHRFIPRAFALTLIAMLAALVVAAQASAATFSNTASITINDATPPDCSPGQPTPAPGAATPYPSTISVSGLGTITDVNVSLTGLSHTFADDVAVLLVGPQGQTTILMADTGGTASVSGVNLTFDDAAANSLPDDSAFASGTYRPTVGTATFGVTGCPHPSSFLSPAPAGPYGSSLSVFNGTDPNGTWSLYVIDDTIGDSGSIAGGWSLDITVVDPAQAIEDLQDTVDGMELPKGLTTALNSKLQNALDALDANDTAGACIWMQSFQGLVDSQTGKKLTTGQAEQLTDAATAIRDQLGC